MTEIIKWCIPEHYNNFWFEYGVFDDGELLLQVVQDHYIESDSLKARLVYKELLK